MAGIPTCTLRGFAHAQHAGAQSDEASSEIAISSRSKRDLPFPLALRNFQYPRLSLGPTDPLASELFQVWHNEGLGALLITIIHGGFGRSNKQKNGLEERSGLYSGTEHWHGAPT